jgi:hypothetical protein
MSLHILSAFLSLAKLFESIHLASPNVEIA